MSFLASLFAGIFSLSCGAAFACVVCPLAAVIFKRKFLHARIALCLLLLSICVAAATAFLLFCKGESPLLFAAENIVFFVALCLAGFLACLFWKIVFPAFVLLYVIFSAYTGVRLYSRFGSHNEEIQISLSDSSVKIGEKSLAVDFAGQKNLAIEEYLLPAKLLLPLPRVWYKVCGVSGGKISSEGNANFIPLEADYLESKNTGLSSFESWLLKNKEMVFAKIPEAKVLPALYRVKFSVNLEKLSYTFEKEL